MNEREMLDRNLLASLAQAMLDGNQSFFEGAVQVLAIKSRLSGIADRDPDFDAFVAIQSETDHLPLKAQRSLWSPSALAALEPEFRRTEEWAKPFASLACKNLIVRFGTGQHA
ncbi:DUF2489 domain-containing protein [Burkholderia sp. NLJ2]|uniref:DUF2489 domain-containing protein n=1 Tax=Burkholderia sp. NLJ2 TaxID=3090699 RepID=UPI003C6BDC1A